MANPTRYAFGTQSAKIGSEIFVSSVNAVGAFLFSVDTVNMAAGDILELRAYKMVITGGTARPEALMMYYGAQPADDYAKESVPISNSLTDVNSLRFSMKQTYGTARLYPWSVDQFS